MMFRKLLLDKKWMMLEVVDKNVFEIMTYNLVLICRIENHNLVFCSFLIHEMCVFC